VTDGPYAETKEQLGGYFLLNCEDLDDAIEWAAKIPNAHSGSVEIRPVMEDELADRIAAAAESSLGEGVNRKHPGNSGSVRPR
jgi:hypothetical protein